MAKIRTTWTPEEDQTIVNALEVYMNANKSFAEGYRELTKFLPGKTASKIESRWKKHLAPLHPEIKTVSKRGGVVTPWTDDEDILIVEKVLDIISEGGIIKDAVEELHKLLPHREMGGISSHWHNELSKRFKEEYEAAKAKGKPARQVKRELRKQNKKKSKSVQLSENFETVESNDVEETNVGYLALATNDDEFKTGLNEVMYEDVSNNPVYPSIVATETVDQIKTETKPDWTVELQEVNHLSNFLTNVTGVVEERNQLRDENKSLRQQNQRLKARLNERDEEFEAMENKYREVMIMISKVQELMNEQSAGSETAKDLESIKLKMERNGNLVRIVR